MMSQHTGDLYNEPPDEHDSTASVGLPSDPKLLLADLLLQLIHKIIQTKKGVTHELQPRKGWCDLSSSACRITNAICFRVLRRNAYKNPTSHGKKLKLVVCVSHKWKCHRGQVSNKNGRTALSEQKSTVMLNATGTRARQRKAESWLERHGHFLKSSVHCPSLPSDAVCPNSSKRLDFITLQLRRVPTIIHLSKEMNSKTHVNTNCL